MENLMDKGSGLSSATKFYERVEGLHRVQYHIHPVTKELIVMDVWAVANGEDDIDYEWEVQEVHNPIIGEISKKLEEINQKIKNHE